MSVEKTIIARARPHILAAKAQEVLNRELSKGCEPWIAPAPVAIEPPYRPLARAEDLFSAGSEVDFVPESLAPLEDLIRLQIWLSPEQEFNWLNSELFLKLLCTVSHRVGFEVVGHKAEIQFRFFVHRNDLPIVQTAFRSQFEKCELTPLSQSPLERLRPDSLEDMIFWDFFSPPPYCHRLTQPDEIIVSSYKPLIAALMEIEPPGIGFYQALLQPVNSGHSWHQNVERLLDFEYWIKLATGLPMPQRHLQQAPSGDLRNMANDVGCKAHNDKPFYSLAVRVGVISGKDLGEFYLKAIATFLSAFQHGGRPLQYITERQYRKALPEDDIMDMFFKGATYRSGFLVNSAELAGIVHVPESGILEHREPPLPLLETLPVRNPDLQEGTPIGTSTYAGAESVVCIPLGARARSTHLIGKPGTAKSTTMGRMVGDDIDKGMGVAVLDPHGDLIDVLLRTIKEEDIERTIYFDPGNPDYVPLWNSLHRSRGQDLSRTADDLVGAFKSVVTGWGDRLEHLMKHGLYALLQLPGSTLLDLSDLLRRGSKESERLRERILEVVDNQTARQFWENDFIQYSNEALGPPKHKLSKLLLSGTLSMMLSQPESAIDFRHIMDNGMIFLADLSTIGSEEREILGCFILSLFHLAALGRSDIAEEKRKQFFLYVDEAHRFLTPAMEDLIAETRKFGASLTLAHHYLSQFGTKKIDALSSVGSTLIMSLDGKDARYLTKDLKNLVKSEDLVNLKMGQLIARIGTDVVKVKMPGPLEIPKRHFKNEIIQRSFKHYYKPVSVVRERIARKYGSGDALHSPLTSQENPVEEFIYEEF